MNENRNFEHTYFERLLKEKSDEFVLYPSKRVWHGIYNNVHPGRKWPSISMSIVLLSILLIIGFLNNPVNNSTNIQNTAKADATVAIIKSASTKNAIDLNQKRVSSVLPISSTEITLAKPNTAAGEPMVSLAETNASLGNNSFNKQGSFTINTDAAIIETIQNNEQASLNESTSTRNVTSTGIINTQSTKQNSTTVNTGFETNTSTLPAIAVNANTVVSNNRIEQAVSAETIVVEKPLTPPVVTNNNTQHQKLAISKAIETGDLDYLNTNEIASQKLVEKDNADQLNVAASSINDNQNFDPSLLKATAFRNNNALPTIRALGLTTSNSVQPTAKNLLSETEKSWIEHYALYHRAAPKKWKGKLEWQQYITPSVVYRSLQNNAADQLIAAQNYLVSRVDNRTLNNMVNQSPNIGLEAGVGLRYPLSKTLKVKAGLQLNFSRYTIHAFDNAHPIATSITLNDNNANQPPYQVYKTTTYSNQAGIQPVNLHNTSLQLSIPLGFDYKIWGNDRMKWYVSSTVQPSVVLLGRNYLLSTDQRNYIRDNDLMNRFNLHAGFETFLAFEKKGYTLQVGPQFRQQIFTTNTRLYTIEERIQQFGFKVGITRKR